MNYITLKVTNLPGIPLDVEVQAVKTVKYAAKECLAALIDHDMVHPCVGPDDPVVMVRDRDPRLGSLLLDEDDIVADLDGESVKVLLVADVGPLSG